MSNIEWTKLKEDPYHWVVTETESNFLAQFAKRGFKRLGPRHLVNWSSTDTKAAMNWLRAQAINTHKAPVSCAVCSFTKHPMLHYAYLSGNTYCSSKCYDTLFGICLDCGQRSMMCLANAKPNLRDPSWGGPENHICDQCHQKKHKWHVATITSR